MSEPRAPRPVAGLPQLDPTALAKAWLVELVGATPLSDVARLPAADLAREAPMLCEAIAGALGDDAMLASLRPGGTLAPLAARAGTLAGAVDPPDVVRACEGLRRAVADALRACVGDAATAADAADRLAYVVSVVATGALGGEPERPARRPAAPPRGIASFVPRPPPPGEPPAASQPEPVVPPEGDDDGPLAAVHDISARAEPSDTWLTVAARALERHTRDGRPFALIAVEVTDAARWLASDPTGDRLERAEAATGEVLRPGDRLARERLGRWWIVAPDSDRAEALELAASVARAVDAAALDVAIACGVAACPADGATTEALVDRADTALFGAQAAGVPVGD